MTIDRHILREWLGIFLIVVMATMGMLLIQAMIEDFRDMLGLGAGVVDMVMYFLVKIPSFLALVLPVMLLISLLYSLGKLHRSNEITAMRSAGLSIGRITRSIWIIGVLMCGLMWFLNASVVPWSIEASQSLLEDMGFKREAKEKTDAASVGVTRVVTFDNEREGRMWFMNRFSRYTQHGYGVTVTEYTLRRQEKLRIYAREAWLDKNRNCWVFHNGRESLFDIETGDVVQSTPFDEKIVPYYREDPNLMLGFDVKPKDLSFFKLKKIMDYFAAEESPKLRIYAMRYYRVLAETFSPLIVILISIPFAMTGVRVNPAVGVSKSLGLFLLNFTLVSLSESLGAQGMIAPILAACLPAIIMTAVGGWFFVRMR